MKVSPSIFARLQAISCGTVSYSEGLLQQETYKQIVSAAKSSPDPCHFALCLQHRPVYTVGIRSKMYSEEERDRLRLLGADFHVSSRGGLITFHGPGQLVIYPIVDLRRLPAKKFGVKTFVDTLEQAVIDCVTLNFQIKDARRDSRNSGVWVGENNKLCAVGIAVQHGITSHGLAINCNTDLTWYDKIVGCGLEGVTSTSLSELLNRDVTVEETAPLLMSRLADLLGFEGIDWTEAETETLDREKAR